MNRPTLPPHTQVFVKCCGVARQRCSMAKVSSPGGDLIVSMAHPATTKEASVDGGKRAVPAQTAAPAVRSAPAPTHTHTHKHTHT